MEIKSIYNIHRDGIKTYRQNRSLYSDLGLDMIEKKEVEFVLAKHKDLKLCDDIFVIRPFKDFEEIVKEGRTLIHAVAFYATGKYARGTDYLFAMRKKNEPDKPFITLEFDIDGNLLLAKKKENFDAKEKNEIEFIEKFRTTVLKPFVINDNENRFINAIDDFALRASQYATNDWQKNHLSIYIQLKDRKADVSCWGFGGVDWNTSINQKSCLGDYLNDMYAVLPPKYKEIHVELEGGILQAINVRI